MAEVVHTCRQGHQGRSRRPCCPHVTVSFTELLWCIVVCHEESHVVGLEVNVQQSLVSLLVTTLQKLCKVHPHTALQGLMMAFTKSLACIIFGGRTGFLKNCAHLTNLWNISIILYKFKYPKYIFLNRLHKIMCMEASQYSDWLWAGRLRGWS
jgi:hypothetical protein